MKISQFTKEQFALNLRILNLLREDVWNSINDNPYYLKKEIQTMKSCQKQKINFSFSRESDENDMDESDKLINLWNFIQDSSDILNICKSKDDRDRGNPFISDDNIIPSV